MSSSKLEQDLVSDMIIRQRNLQKRTKVIAKMRHDYMRFKRQIITLLTILSAILLLCGYYQVANLNHITMMMQIQVGILFFGLAILVSGYVWYHLINRWPLKKLLQSKKARLRVKNAGSLLAAKRWLQFYYQGRDIAPIIGEVLFYLESQQWQPTVAEAITHFDQSKQAPDVAQARYKLAKNVVQTNEMILSTVTPAGQPASRQMRFIKLPDVPEVWYFGTAPNTPKIADLDLGVAAVHTLPTAQGMTIASNRLTVKRSHYRLDELAPYYLDQVPGFMDGLTKEDRDNEIIYEIHLESVRLDTWVQHEQLTFRLPNSGDTQTKKEFPTE